MRRKCRERFPRHRLQRKPLVSDPDMHHGTCVTHVPWCMSVSLNRSSRENVPGIPGACATRSFSYLARGPLWRRGILWWHGFRTTLGQVMICCLATSRHYPKRHWLLVNKSVRNQPQRCIPLKELAKTLYAHMLIRYIINNIVRLLIVT